MLEIKDKLKPLKLAAKVGGVGDSVATLGFFYSSIAPGDFKPGLVTGCVSNPTYFLKNGTQRVAQFSLPFEPGGSGGPVFDLLSGNVIAMAISTEVEKGARQGMFCYGVNSATIKSFIRAK
jgi:S1-C subfamily serine protease